MDNNSPARVRVIYRTFMYEKELQSLGMAEKEAKVYLTSIELGPETVQNLAKRSGINRATTYVQIEMLKKKGLMSEFEKGKKTFYTAESPDRLHSFVSNMQKEIDMKKSDLDRILPTLQNIFSGAGERAKVRFYEGMEGILALREEFLKNKGKRIESFTNLDMLFNLFPKHEDEYTPKRIAKKITGYVIYTRKEGPVANATDPSKFRVARYMPENEFPVSAEISIYDDNISIATNKEHFMGVIISDKFMADTMRALFYGLWNKLEK